MNYIKRLLCWILCISMVLSLAGCGMNDATTAQETQVAADSYLAIAKEFIDQEDFGSAIAVLEQAAVLSDDPRILEMLHSIQNIEITYSVNDMLYEGSVEIHDCSAVRQKDGDIRYTISYTASEGMSVAVIDPPNGEKMYSILETRTTGEQDAIIFELNKEDAKSLSEIAVVFDSSFFLQITNPWAEETESSKTAPAITTEEKPDDPGMKSGYITENHLKEGTAEVFGCTIWKLDNGNVRYELDYYVPAGMTVSAFDPPDAKKINIRKEGFTTGNREQFTFEIESATLDEINAITIAFVSQDLNDAYYVFLENNLYLASVTDGKPVGEPETGEVHTESQLKSGTVEISDCQIQNLSNGYIRHTIAFCAPAGMSVRIQDPPNGDAFKYIAEAKTTGTLQELTFDIPKENAGAVPYLLVLFEYENKNERFFVSIRSPLYCGQVPTKEEQPEIPRIEPEWIYPQSSTQEPQKVDASSDIDGVTRQIEQNANALKIAPTVDKDAFSVDTSKIQPLSVSRKPVTPKAAGTVQPYEEFWYNPFPAEADLSDCRGLAYSITFSDETIFSDKMPDGFNPQALLEWGKEPGLNVDVLHKLGYTGKGSVIAYVDQPVNDHSEYVGDNFHIASNTNAETSMHGPAVLSLLAGKEIGTAPEAEVWFYGHAAWEADQSTHAECLYQIIEQNKQLPDDQKITMVGFSDNIDPSEKNAKAFEDAVKACEEAGIMVWFCGEYASAAFLPLSDKNNYANVISDQWYVGTPELVYVPAGSRTTATGDGGNYIYWASGGLSWTMPYVLGIYAIVNEIDPSLTQDDLRKMIVDTAYVKGNMKIINPVEFVAAALEGVGRTKDARELRNASAANQKYTYAIMNKSKMSTEDIAAAERYLMGISDSTVLVVDSTSITDAQKLYTVLQADHLQRGGEILGVQIFGNADLVPSFDIGYRVQMPDGADDAGRMLTDLFYGNFNNATEDIGKGYNVMDHFEKGWNIQLVPEWKVVRLPLAKGEFKAFFDKYMDFAATAGLGQQTLVNFSNPIFANSNHTDDMGYFLNRLSSEFGINLGEYRLYGNQMGQYPVTTDVLGGFTTENLAAENRSGVCEFIINTHGQRNNVDKCWFEGGQEKRESLMNMTNINSILAENPYYLDMWTCNNGEGMKDNMTTAALSGNCVGMFSNTHIISNNGVNNQASLQAMTESNFYWFYLHYLKALSEGASRSDAFFDAQKAYGNALIVDSQNELRSEGNYQFNLYNLLGYHNFGVLEPNAAFSCINSAIS